MDIIIKSENIYDNDFSKKNSSDTTYVANYNNIVKNYTQQKDVVSQEEYVNTAKYPNPKVYECTRNRGDTLENITFVEPNNPDLGRVTKFLSKEIVINAENTIIFDDDADIVLGHKITAASDPASGYVNRNWMTVVIDYEKTTNNEDYPNGRKERIHIATPVFIVESEDDFKSISFFSKNSDGSYRSYEKEYIDFVSKYVSKRYTYLVKRVDEYGTETEEWVSFAGGMVNVGECFPFPFLIGIDVKRSTSSKLVFYFLTAVGDVAPSDRNIDAIPETFSSTSSLIAMFNHDIFCTEIRVAIGTTNISTEHKEVDSTTNSYDELPTNELTQLGNTITINGDEIPFDQYLTNECNRNYENGKETFEIECSVNDYYYGSWDSANNRLVYELDELGKPRKAIDITGSQTDKMVFEIGDTVIPMKYTNKGDVPMSQYIDGTARAYRVTGVSYSYDGVVMQKIRGQEIARENLTNSIMSANIETYRSMR